MATANPTRSTPRAPDRAVFANRLDEVDAARWVEAAVAAQYRTQRVAIDPDHRDQQPCGDADQRSQQRVQARMWHGNVSGFGQLVGGL